MKQFIVSVLLCVLLSFAVFAQSSILERRVVNAASFEDAVAPGSIAAIFTNPTLHTSASLKNTKITITDRRKIAHSIETIFFSAPTQTNFYIPKNVATGPAEVEVKTGAFEISKTTIILTHIAPGLFSANSNGVGVPAAVLLRVSPGGVQTYIPLFRFSEIERKYVPIPIDLATDKVFLVLFGTGIRNNPALEDVKVFLGNVSVPVYYAGSQGLPSTEREFLGLDQVNVLLPTNLPSGQYVVSMNTANLPTNNLVIQVR